MQFFQNHSNIDCAPSFDLKCLYTNLGNCPSPLLCFHYVLSAKTAIATTERRTGGLLHFMEYYFDLMYSNKSNRQSLATTLYAIDGQGWGENLCRFLDEGLAGFHRALQQNRPISAMYLDFRRKVFGLIRPYQQKRFPDVVPSTTLCSNRLYELFQLFLVTVRSQSLCAETRFFFPNVRDHFSQSIESSTKPKSSSSSSSLSSTNTHHFTEPMRAQQDCRCYQQCNTASSKHASHHCK